MIKIIKNVVRKQIVKDVSFLFIAFTISGLVQYNILIPHSGDTAYHAAVGRLIAQHGILHSFPWTPFSWVSSHYGDKELLFHLLFVPLSSIDWILASKIVGTLCGAIFLWTMWFILGREKVRLASIWAITPLAMSSYFIFRFTLVRPFLLSVALSAVLLWAARREKLPALAITAALYPWLYVAFWQLPLMMLVIAEASRFLSTKKVSFRSAFIVFPTILFSLLLHPNGKEVFMTSWVNMTEMFIKNTLGSQANFEMGKELLPFSPWRWLHWMVPTVSIMVAASILAWRERKQDRLGITFTLAALAFFIFTLKSAKFAEYYIPFSALSLALVSHRIQWKWFPQSLVVVTLVLSLLLGPEVAVQGFIHREDLEETIWPYLQEQIPIGSQVFTTDWEFTGLYMLALPDRKFIVALDPTFFSRQNSQLYNEWFDIIRSGPENSVELIRSHFHSRYVMGLNHPSRYALFSRLISAPGVRVLLTGRWFLFDLGPALGAP
jgi:hypothetical protein